jgi:hypothetical protein
MKLIFTSLLVALVTSACVSNVQKSENKQVWTKIGENRPYTLDDREFVYARYSCDRHQVENAYIKCMTANGFKIYQ